METEPQASKPSQDPLQFEVIFAKQQSDSPSPSFAIDTDVLGRLRRELFWTLGESRMHGAMTRIGFSRGQHDAQQSGTPLTFLKNLGSITEVKSGGIQHEYIFETTESCEALEHIRYFNDTTRMTQCGLLAGYLTGFISWQKQRPLYFLEVKCRARKDPVCRFEGRPRSHWGEEDDVRLNQYDEDNMALELKETREQLTHTKDRYQNLFEESSLPIFIIDPETGVHIDVNNATESLTGFSRDALLKMNVFDLHPTEEHHQLANEFKSLLFNEPIENRETVLIRKDGSRRTMAHSTKILSYGGRSVIQTIMRDITDLKESEKNERALQQQLIRSERLSSIGRLAAGVAHELKNPLGAIRNAIYYIQNALSGNPLMEADPNMKKIIKLAEAEVDSSVRIIGELLDFSRVVELVPRRTQVNNLLEILPTIFSIPENIQLNMDLDMTLPSAVVDPDRLNQVFSNVFNNAVQAMPKGGTLTIRSRLEIQQSGMGDRTEMITIVFEDTGSGIEPVHLKKIFEPLFTTKARGTGLGLAISSNIIEKHKGAIQANSQVGKGTAFTIKLPLNAYSNSEE